MREYDLSQLESLIHVWSEPDPTRGSALLGLCWTEESEIVGPGYYSKGTQAVLDEVAPHG